MVYNSNYQYEKNVLLNEKVGQSKINKLVIRNGNFYSEFWTLIVDK